MTLADAELPDRIATILDEARVRVLRSANTTRVDACSDILRQKVEPQREEARRLLRLASGMPGWT